MLTAVSAGIGLGNVITDFAMRWMGWTGPDTSLPMIAAFLTWASFAVFSTTLQKRRRRRAPEAARRPVH